jgi:hypothetical protein
VAQRDQAFEAFPKEGWGPLPHSNLEQWPAEGPPKILRSKKRDPAEELKTRW